MSSFWEHKHCLWSFLTKQSLLCQFCRYQLLLRTQTLLVKFLRSPVHLCQFYSKEVLLRRQALLVKFPEKWGPPLPVLKLGTLAENKNSDCKVPWEEQSSCACSTAWKSCWEHKHCLRNFFASSAASNYSWEYEHCLWSSLRRQVLLCRFYRKKF